MLTFYFGRVCTSSGAKAVAVMQNKEIAFGSGWEIPEGQIW